MQHCGSRELTMPAIATEVKVINKLKEEGIDKNELGREGFLKRCLGVA